MGKNNKKINIIFEANGANQMVTGSSSILTIKVKNKETKIMIDCGAIQNGKFTTSQLFKMNKLDRNMGDIGHVILTHAHL